jgi:hypothetical protein
MTAAPAPVPPGSRTLLAWWRELAPFHPRGLWLSRLPLHRIEALVELAPPRRLDPLRLALLRGLATGAPDPANLDRRILEGLRRSLASEGLILGRAGIRELTAVGREALAEGSYHARALERRAFYFVDNTSCQRPPHYLNLRPALRIPCLPPEGWHFDPALLQACVRQSPDWKRRHGFPEEVTGVLEMRAAEGAADWRRVVFDSPEQLLALFILTPSDGGGAALLGFQIEERGWVLHHEFPALSFQDGWEEELPDLTREQSPEVWQLAWRGWCHQRGLPVGEAAACRLERADHRLLVHAPRPFVERLRAIRSDALKGETWLLAGGGRTQAAALVEIVGDEKT